MARQIEKFSDKFKAGGDKDGSAEEKFFTDPDIQIDPEWKAMDLLRSQIETISDSVNANDAASGSYADLKKAYITDSGSFATRATINDAKTTFPGLGTTSKTAFTGNLGADNSKGVKDLTAMMGNGFNNKTGQVVILTLNDQGVLVITVGSVRDVKSYTQSVDR